MPKRKKNSPWRRNFFKRRINNGNRNWDDPIYKAWRKKVYVRDKFKCRWPGCSCKRKLHAHHILKWADYPGLRFNVANGITLCRKHHDMIRNKEENYAKTFQQLLSEKPL